MLSWGCGKKVEKKLRSAIKVSETHGIVEKWNLSIQNKRRKRKTKEKKNKKKRKVVK